MTPNFHERGGKGIKNFDSANFFAKKMNFFSTFFCSMGKHYLNNDEL
jgi:hypothetical protein